MGLFLEVASYVDGMEPESREEERRNEGGKPSWEENSSKISASRAWMIETGENSYALIRGDSVLTVSE